MLVSIVLFLLFLMLVNLLGYHGLRKSLSYNTFKVLRPWVLRFWWILDLGFIVFTLVWIKIIRSGSGEDYELYRRYFVITAVFMLIYLPKLSLSLFTLLYELKRLLIWVSLGFIPLHLSLREKLAQIRRSMALPSAGLFAAFFMFSVTLYGLSHGRFNFSITKSEVWFQSLPEAFDGYRIVQISDAHLGSFARAESLLPAIDLIQSLDPDIIVFTGDMVNNQASEAIAFVPVFQRLRARDGKFSVLGNHDMGDYRRWGTIQEKESDIDKLVSLQQEMGFVVLRNQHVFLIREQDSIMIAGVDNWGDPPFAQYGDLQAALGQESFEGFRLLLSHDPSHWRAEVLPDKRVHLTLSGHTHGMQFGVSNRFFSWSPVQLKYPEWSGLYREEGRKLYVNRGLGFLSFPGRIGMPPEISLIELRSKSSAERHLATSNN